MESPGETTRHSTVGSLIDELGRAIKIVGALDDDAYSQAVHGESSIGAHIRHNLEFVHELLNGIAERRVDYSARSRDSRIENDREYACEQLLVACHRLSGLTRGILLGLVIVRSEVDEDIWHTSSVSREIEFLHSHTVHHYALIARRIVETGSLAEATLGVAPSTLRFRAGSASTALRAG